MTLPIMNASTSTIVLVDDNPLLADAYSTALTKAGFTVRVAHDGSEGILLSKELVPQLILLDIRLHGMNGIEVLEQLKQHEKTRDIPVIVFTMSEEKAHKERALALGAVEYLNKNDTSLKELVEHITSSVLHTPAGTSTNDNL